jgi:hypothetical protein
MSMVVDGLARSLTNPLGYGLGATTLAASKFGAIGGTTELDLTNMFVSLGPVGGLLYTLLLCMILASTFRHWHRNRRLSALGVAGILLVTLGQWLNGGQYATSMLVWFCIGALDRAQREAS